MFNADFFPTPLQVIEQMTAGIELEGKTILEPSAGSGAIVDYLQEHGANVIACENDSRLKLIIKSKCKHIADDFLTVTSEQISHVNSIIMNPPFSRGAEHLLHAYNIAPAGCKIVSLLNAETVKNTYSQSRKELFSIIQQHGNIVNLENCFNNAERQTGVNVAMITINKPGENYSQEFEGFFMDDEPEESGNTPGLMSYNVVRDLVNRYVAAVKLYDEHLNTGKKMNSLLSGFYGESLTFTCTENGAAKLRNEFKKDLQKAGWAFIFNKMNLTKYTTRGVKEDINKFVEQQTNIPFTMRNIYVMLDIVVQTAGQRMNKAILEVFDRVTEHHHDNRHNVKGWKTNSHFLVGKKFILPNMIRPAKEYGYTSQDYSNLRSSYDGIVPDFEKALCYITGKNYDTIQTLNGSIRRNIYGDWYESEFFKYKGYKNGNMHFEFMSDDVWAMFNKKVAELKGYPLYEAKEQTAYQERQTGRAYQKKSNPAHQYKPTVLFEI
ncbi:DUF4942 domain-containing protein [Lacibacter sp. MH-610]|uniref:DUF4942 domain-containing protein n=1 Tax=Lacibacter sp. MH-610 TaxID=3020883 RepID=UPI00389172C7